MSLKRRLSKIENLVGKNKDSAPLVIIYKNQVDKGKKLREYREKYKERRPVILLPEQRSEW